MKSLRYISNLRRRGGAVLETALVLPVLISITFGAIEFGYYFWIQNTLEGAARNGARAAIISGATNTDVTSAVNAELTAAGLKTSSYTITTNPTSISGASAGTNITVTVGSTWGQVGFKALGIIGSSQSINGTCVMRHE
ncbi:MAG TPA: TadE/TadG family type IV pilus assembly protein [Tepidisphaeraceae bacterium]|nr:TadE/TadG family type IV pilus assembly protein [Tepidisphaeraceae bacterium]